MTLPPNPPYRGPLRWMEGAPSVGELAGVGALALGAGLMFLIAWRLLLGHLRSQWDGLPESGSRTLLWASISALTGYGLLSWLWVSLEDLAARMGTTVAVLVVLLMTEARSSRRRRRT